MPTSAKQVHSGRSKNRSTHILATWGIVVFIAAACTVLIGLQALHVVNQRSDVLAASRKDTANLTGSLIQHAELTFRTADTILIGLVERLEHQEVDSKVVELLNAWFVQELRQSPQLINLSVVDDNGMMIASSFDTKEPIRFSDREYLTYHRTHDDDGLHISIPIKGRSANGWIIPVTRRFNRADGSFGGVAIASINPQYFQSFYDQLELGHNSVVYLVKTDGTILVRRPFVDSNVGRNLARGHIFTELKKSPQGSFEAISSTDGIRRLNSYAQGHTYPVVVAVGQGKTEVLAPWKQSAIREFVQTSAITMFIVLMGAFVWRATRTLASNSIELRETNTHFDAALTNMSNGLSMFDAEGKLMVWNEKYLEIYGMSPEVVSSGASITSIVEHRKEQGNLELDVEAYVGEFQQMLIDTGRSVSTSRLKDGRIISVVNTAIEGGGWVAMHEDITERRRTEAEIVHLARHDALTGLANRAEFNAKLEEASRRLKRGGGAVTVMMLDLDKFKAVNDALGHPAGDQLLVDVGQCLQSVLRDTDVLARIGGDEFAIIQEGGDSQHEGAIALALRIINAIAQPFDLNGHQASVGISIGIVLAPEHGTEPDELLKKADLALYDVKAMGRNDFRVFQSEMLDYAKAHQSAESELRDAIAREEFELHYQPVMDINTRLLFGVEALVRWRHPAKGLIPPDEFISLAETTGLIVPLGEWILQRACADAASWPSHVKMAVNISAVQLNKANFFEIILSNLVETGLAPERLELEITETSLLENKEAILATIRQLKNLGISIALDDFGTGYSSLSYLTTFPFDKIKIDKKFTQGALERRDCAAIISSVRALAQGFGTITTAEGIETEEQLAYMREAGVDLAQGYLIGRPVPIHQLNLNNSPLAKTMVA